MFNRNKKELFNANIKLKLLAHKHLLNVDKFNEWFCDDTKSRDIYAHSGIYLRLDKLSNHHIQSYWESLINIDESLIEEMVDDFSFILSNFHDNIRISWLTKIHNKL